MKTISFRRSLITSLIACVSVIVWNAPVVAQGISPELLQQLERRQNRGRFPERVSSPVDRSAEDAEFFQGPNELTDEELYLLEREREEREKPTRLEADYRSRLQQPELSQFGYDLLYDERVMDVSRSAGRIGDHYVVGVGDEFAIVLQGNESQDYVTKVDMEGRLLILGLSPISAAGRTVAEIRSEVEARVAEAFIGTEVYISLGALAQITVVVSGEVEAPGAYQLTAQDTALDALLLARGVRKTGSLRQVSVLRGDKQITVDLYRLFRGQAGAGIQLRDGDQIVVPPLGDTYAVAGEVLRPAIYELPKGVTRLSAQTAIKVAGNTIRPRGYELVLSRLDRLGNEIVDQINRTDQMISGDGLVVVRTSARARGKVSVSGHVAAPGMRALSSAPTLDALLQRSGGFLGNPYLPFAALVRENPTTLNRKYTAVNLLSKGSDQGIATKLQDGDQLLVLNRKDVLFLSSETVRKVILNRHYDGSFTCQPLQDLALLTQDLQTERYASVLRGTFILEDQRGGEVRAVQVAASTDDESVATVQDELEVLTDEALEELEDDERNKILAERCPTIYSANKGLLNFVLEHVATAAGSIRQPLVMPIAGKQALSTIVDFAGGLSFEASLTNVEITQPKRLADKNTLSRAQFDLTEVSMDDISVEPGASVFFQSVPTDQEPGTVLLSGEFQRPGVYTIRRGETLSSVIMRAGGVTERGYPFGAVFTRVSVKRAQDQAFKRTVREMNTALTTAALKSNVDSSALAAARELTASMRSVEAVGRVVVEADPRVLRLRKDLDIIMEPGDRIYMPKRPNHVLAMGDVLNPGALQFVKGKKVRQYLAETGGIQASADESRLFLVYPNGVARPVSRRLWGTSNETLPPGTTIVVPKDTDPLAALQLTREVTAILSQFALSAASFAVVFN